jgi:hypothetical protein
MPILSWISEKPMKKLAAVLFIFTALAGCGKLAPKNPLGPSIAPTPAIYACPARFNFEGSGALTNWFAPSWAGGFVGAPILDGQHTWCGTQAMKDTFSLNGSNQAIFWYTFPQGVNVTGTVVTVHVYFDSPPPANLGLEVYFVDRQAAWQSPAGANHWGMKQGWNEITENFNMPGVSDVVNMILQFQTMNGATYAGNVWVDEITW